MSKVYIQDSFEGMPSPKHAIRDYHLSADAEVVTSFKVGEVYYNVSDNKLQAFKVLGMFVGKYNYTGGRWAGKIKVKEGVGFTKPEFSWGWSEDARAKILAERRTDSARIRDIDNLDELKCAMPLLWTTSGLEVLPKMRLKRY